MLLTLFYFLLALLLLICIHEYGHFIVARLCGVKVLRFSFGFGKVLFSWKDKHQTEFVWSLWPLGGYVKMLDETEGEVAVEERHRAFNVQPLWKRILIVLAGPLFNFLFAIVAFWLAAVIGIYSLAPIIEEAKEGSIVAQAGIQSWDEITAINTKKTRSWRDVQFSLMPYLGSGDTITVAVKNTKTGQTAQYALPLEDWELDPNKPDALKSLGITPFIPNIPPVVGDVEEGGPAEEAGLQKGDRVVQVDGVAMNDWLEMVNYVRAHPNKALQFTIQREGRSKTVKVNTGEKIVDNDRMGYVGLRVQKQDWPKEWLRIQKDDPLKAIGTALTKTWQLSDATLRFIGRLITGRLSLNTVSGPIGIAQGAGQSGKSGVVYYLSFLALVSISLGVLNLLPIPMLDGGHLLFYLIELLRRKPVSEGARIAFTYAGFLALMALMVVAMSNDIVRLSS